jgi:hypothetical protein
MLWVEEGLRNVTYLFLKFLMVKIDTLNVVSHVVHKNVTMTLNEDLLCVVLAVTRISVSKKPATCH